MVMKVVLNEKQNLQLKIVLDTCKIKNDLVEITGCTIWDKKTYNDIENLSNFYNFENEQLTLILSTLHYRLNILFTAINSRFKNGNRYLRVADKSEFIIIYSSFKKTREILKSANYLLEMNKNYKNSLIYFYNLANKKDNNDLPQDCQFLLNKIVDLDAIFSITKNGIFNSPKYLYFGVSNPKPDITISNILDADLEVLNKEEILIYDKEIGESLLYGEFKKWWKENQQIYKWYNAKKELNVREQKFSDFYKKKIGEENMDKYPVLLPQVYLHYDPKTQAQREKMKKESNIKFQRMDFLILYEGKRVIIELDGESHYSKNNNTFNAEKYTNQLVYDRTMKFLGYDVFRISNEEIDSENYQTILNNFFDYLFVYLNIKSPHG